MTTVAARVVVVATTNQGKLHELRLLLHDLPLDLRSLADFAPLAPVVEDGQTYVENAAKKALAVARATRETALADDSGLEVDALGGAPGLHSARFAGPAQNDDANVDKLLDRLRGVDLARRTARFRCAIVVAQPDGQLLVAEGACEGRITLERRGTGGFGYDPVFLYEPTGQTFAELPPATKDRISHRADAIARLRSHFLSHGGHP